MRRLTRVSRSLAMGGLAVAVVGVSALVVFSGKPVQSAIRNGTAPAAQHASFTPAATVPAPASQATSVATANNVVQALSTTFEQVASQASPAVVHIQIEKDLKAESPAAFFGPNGLHQGEGGPATPQDFFRFFFGPGQGGQAMPGQPAPDLGPVPVGQGSGFILTPDGYIVTNNHVVDGADRLRVTLADGREFTAKVVGTDPETEIALIKVDAQGLPTLPLGNSDNLRVGEWVLAIGSPFGLDHSVTSGIVSARGRGNVGIVDYADFIQTDAAINPGNSGGPLLDMKGQVIGMNTAILSRTGGSNGIGFAIPVNMIKYVTDQLREHGTITRGFLGISIQGLTPELAKWFNVKQDRGVLIAEVSKGSPADHAGLQRDDVIVALNGQPVGEAGAFRSRIATTAAGSKVDLTIIRNGQRMDKTIQVGSKPAEQVAMNTGHDQGTAHTDLGIAVEGLTNDTAKHLGYEGDNGVVVAQVTPGSAAARAGIKPGDLIQEVNKQKIDNPREFESAIKHDSKNHTALLLLKEGQGSRYVALETA